VDFPLVPVSLEVQANDSDNYDKKIYLSEHNLSKFVSSMIEIG
jgi:hypothetical protein